MWASVRLGIGLALALVGAAPLRATAADHPDVQIAMSVDGSKGPFGARGYRAGNGVKVLNVVMDLSPGVGSTAASSDARSGLKPVLVTKPVDRTSWEFLDALASGEILYVVITFVQPSTDDGVPMRRVVTLSNARVASIHDALDAKNAPAQGLGVETVAFTYDRIEVEDDGVRVFSAGG